MTGSTADVGYWANQLDPKYMVGLATTKTSAGANILSAQATTANIALAQAAMPGISVPYTGYATAGNLSSKATIQQMLLHFPQYYGVSNTWGQNVGNNNYQALQVSLIQRQWKGLDLQVHYTFSKNIGDDGTYRSGYDIPGAAMDGGRHFARGRADRSWTTVSLPQYLRAFGVYQLPFGKGQIGANNYWVSKIAGGWFLSGIFSYTSGAPLAIVGTTCYSIGGTCMPSKNPAYTKKTARINGKWTMDSTPHIDSSAFIQAGYYSGSTTCTSNCGTAPFGNAPRTRAYGLSNPSRYNLDMGLRREFELPWQHLKLDFAANCSDVTHEHYYSGIGVTLPASTYNTTYDTSSSSSTFGRATSASGNRDWQFAAHIKF